MHIRLCYNVHYAYVTIKNPDRIGLLILRFSREPVEISRKGDIG